LAYSACSREATIIEQSAGHAAHLLLSAKRPLIFTGAGVSAESGIPTFRGPGGLWKSYRAEDLATPEGFARDPRLCWEWYGWRRDLIQQCQPNPAHRAIALWMLRKPETTLITQNVDGLHDRTRLEQPNSGGGSSPSVTICLHGSIFRVRCSRCGESWAHQDPIDATGLDTLPHCQRCSGLLRPDVVWFGEMLPEPEMARASEAAARADVVLVIGTQGSVYPASGLVTLAHRSGARIVVVDPGETAFDGIAAIKLTGKAGELVPQVLGGTGAG
jgi:NAD-dependent deacetylase